MRKLILSAAALLAALSLQAQEKVRFMPNWIPQAQFAGYYMAQEKGFYTAEGLDVEILNMSASSSMNPLDEVAKGNIDICTAQLVQAIMARSNGVKVVDILQTSQNSSLVCVSHSAIKSIGDLNGLRIGRWKAGYGETADMACREYGIQPTWVYYLNGINLFVSKAIDAMLAYKYSEYLHLLFAQGEINESNIIDFGEVGFNFPEDAAFTSEKYYKKHKDAVEKFVRASIRGWQYAAKNREETLDVVMRLEKENNITTSRAMQKMMLDEVLNTQIDKKSGIATFQQMEEELFGLMNDELISIGLIEKNVNYKDFIK